MIELRRYTPEDASAWNTFMALSKNGTFLFDRHYMDYHADRFHDHSLIFSQKGHVKALLPANEDGNRLSSHQGLTYGGLLLDSRTTITEVCEIFQLIAEYMREKGFSQLLYKPAPTIYQQIPAEEDLYALSQLGHLRLLARDAASVIDLSNPLRFTELRRRCVKKALRQELYVAESEQMADFWAILENNLQRQYQAKPVHSLQEIQLLKSRFPKNIRLYCTYQGKTPVAGVLLYITPQVVRTQYISASTEGKTMGALDLLFDHLINNNLFQHRYLDMGTSALAGSHTLNTSLVFQKEGFGARTICFDCYEWTPDKTENL